MGRENGREGDETGARLFEPRACEVRSVVHVSVGVAGVDAVNIFVICPLVFLNSSFTVYSHIKEIVVTISLRIRQLEEELGVSIPLEEAIELKGMRELLEKAGCE